MRTLGRTISVGKREPDVLCKCEAKWLTGHEPVCVWEGREVFRFSLCRSPFSLPYPNLRCNTGGLQRSFQS